MRKIGLFFGTRTGETMEVAEEVQEAFQTLSDQYEIVLQDLSESQLADFDHYDILVLGTSTYKSGDLAPDWEAIYPELTKKDFSNKTVALFGLGNSLEYADTFASGMGIIARIVEQNNGQLIGKWSTEGYDYDESYSQADSEHFYGLVLDQDYEAEMTESRVHQWVKQLLTELP
jgi:flavodoxin I